MCRQSRHAWGYADHDYETCANVCSPYGETFYATADPNLDAPCYEAKDFVNLASENLPEPSLSNYYDCSGAPGIFPDAQYLFAPTVPQDLHVPDYAANHLGPAPDSAPLPASKYPEKVPPMAADSNFDSLNAAAPLPATTQNIFPIRVIARKAASPQRIFQENNHEPTSAYTSATLSPTDKPDFSDTDPPALQSASTESENEPPTSTTLPVWSTAFASPNMFSPLQPYTTLPAAETASTPIEVLPSISALPGFTIVQRADHSITSSTTRVPTTNRVVKACRRHGLVGVRKHPRRHEKKKNTPYCRSLPSSPPVVLQYACAPPPTKPWKFRGPPPCSFSDCKEETASDDSATSSIHRGTFWASENDEATPSTLPPQQHHSPHTFHTSVPTVHEDLDWLEANDFFDAASFATRAICHSVNEYYRASATRLLYACRL